MLVGYARVSSVSQSLEHQVELLEAAGCEKVYSEKKSGKSAADRPALQRALDQVREGDALVVTRLDRLARSVTDLHKILERLTVEGVSFRCLQQGSVDTATSTGKLTLAILGAVAEFENDIRRERQRDGIAKAKARGIYRGRKRSIDAAAVLALKQNGMGASAIARQLGIARASVYRALGTSGA
jgi:DNA invertase Pin-like site-specific DNA recombinase